ncbi:MAG TPA: HAD-IIIA family hydrolase [Solirubrobacteraceae bacterium]
MTAPVAIVVPTVRPAALARLLRSLEDAGWDGPVVVVDDRVDGATPAIACEPAPAVELLRGCAAGPAAARNLGWRHARAEWVAFLDDDVVVPPGWPRALRADLARVDDAVAGSQGRIDVPLPRDRRPTDWERDVAGLQDAWWATADMAYRRSALAALGGFDERFGAAYREDSDLALRALRAGWRLERGVRHVTHPVGRARPLVSVRRQAGNADDVLMRALHGPRWREEARAPSGRLRGHVATTAAAAAVPAALAAAGARAAATPAALWAASTAAFAWQRIRPGPRTARELAVMALTSVLIPPAATLHHLRGRVRARALTHVPARPLAVLLDRDGTLVVDVPYNGDPERVAPAPGALAALERLRLAGLKLAVISNQSGVGRGLLTAEQVTAVNRRVEELLGPLGPWLVCPHAPEAGCGCRKPEPGLVFQAAALLGVDPRRCAVVGDIGADMQAARAAGARGVLVPTPATRAAEIRAAAEVAKDLEAAVDLLLRTAA